MASFLRSRLRVLLALLLLSALSAVEADATTCQVLDINGLSRDCTYTERMGSCGSNAYDSYYQCLRAADDTWGHGSFGDAVAASGCQIALGIDLTACLGSATLRTIFE